jgi:hypothetical protein
MLQICSKLGVGFRAHVKSHKTLELSKVMVGDGLPGFEGTPAQFIVSTIAEAENLAEYVTQEQARGRQASVRPIRLVLFIDFADMYRFSTVFPCPRALYRA